MSTATKGKRPMRHLTASDKIDAIQRIHDGESKASVARDIGVPESTLRGWCKNEEKLRYMSHQSTSENKVDKLTEDAVAAGLLGQLGGPPDKRQKLDTSLPLNFASNGGKLKYDDFASSYKRNSLGGLDLTSNSDLNGLSHSDFSAFAKSADLSGLQKSKEMSLKGYGAELTKPADPTKGDMSMTAISPLTSLSHLSGMSSLGQSPLALSFNEIATNLNLIAQFNNPNLTAMSGLNQLNNTSPSLRNVRPKNSSGPNLSPRNNNTIDQDKLNHGLTVKHLSKLQKGGLMGLNLSDKSKKMPSTMSTNRDAPVDDALWYWLKSQQAMLGLNSLYSSMSNATNASAQAPSPSQQQQQHQPLSLFQPPQQQLPQHHLHHHQPPSQTPTPPTVSSPQITPPFLTSSATSDDTKNSSWFWQWYKTFGTSILDKQNTININGKIRTDYDNILYSQLTKETNCDNLNNNTIKPEDLSQQNNAHDDMTEDEDHSGMITSPDDNVPSDLSILIKCENHEHENDHDISNKQTYNENGSPGSPNDVVNHEKKNTSGKTRAVLDDLLFNNNNSNATNNNNNDIKSESDAESDISNTNEAVQHGEKFLKWLETYSDPSVTAMQVMQFKFLLNTIKSSADRANNPSIMAGEDRIRIRRRK